MKAIEWEAILALIFGVVVVIAVATILWHGYIVATETVVVSEPPPSVHIDHNDTLWGLAKMYYPGQHTGKTVHAIRELNPDLDPAKLQVGQVVYMPF